MSPFTQMRRVGLAVLLLLCALPGAAQELMMVRSPHSFPEAMLTLQSAIGDHGYTLSRVQRVDIGLTGSGFTTDKYRVVFFGKIDEIRMLTSRYPQLIPYLPLHMTIFAEEEETIVVMEDPARMANLVPDPEVAYLFRRWHNDVLSILEQVSQE
ncbi:MAG TPA: DUF302 domain-containing protein [Gammaproteobacteria bacterium]